MARAFNLADPFEVVAGAETARIAFIRGPQRLGYRQLDRGSSRLASKVRWREGHRGARRRQHQLGV